MVTYLKKNGYFDYSANFVPQQLDRCNWLILCCFVRFVSKVLARFSGAFADIKDNCRKINIAHISTILCELLMIM